MRETVVPPSRPVVVVINPAKYNNNNKNNMVNKRAYIGIPYPNTGRTVCAQLICEMYTHARTV